LAKSEKKINSFNRSKEGHSNSNKNEDLQIIGGVKVIAHPYESSYTSYSKPESASISDQSIKVFTNYEFNFVKNAVAAV